MDPMLMYVAYVRPFGPNMGLLSVRTPELDQYPQREAAPAAQVLRAQVCRG